MSDKPTSGSGALLYSTKNGKVAIESSDTPANGDEVLLSPTSDGKYTTHGASPNPKAGDDGLLVPTGNGKYVYISGGIQGCDPTSESYFQWYKAGIDATPWQGKHIIYLDMIWSSKEFKAIKFDIYFIGHCKIWAFGQVVLDMLSPTDDEGYAVEYHLQQTYISDNPCGQRAVRLLSEPAGIMSFGTLRGDVQIQIGRNGTINPGVEVVTP